MPDSKIPVTILIGFLGSGKTTRLNRILSERHGRRVAVIEDELGEVGVDQGLVLNADEECICCSVRGGLIRVLANLMKRRDRFDRVLVETTGLADPGPVAQTFFLDEDVQENFPARRHRHAHRRQASRPSPRGQQGGTRAGGVRRRSRVEQDRSRGRGHLGRPRAAHRPMNAMARILRSHKANVPLAKVLDIGGFDLGRALDNKPTFLDPEYPLEWGGVVEGDGDLRLVVSEGPDPTMNVVPINAKTYVAGHPHDDTVTSVGIELDGAVNRDRFNAWLGNLLREQGADIFRSKGILDIKGDDNRFVFQGVHMLLDGSSGRPWGTARRTNQLCFIGRKLDRETLNAGFRACLA